MTAANEIAGTELVAWKGAGLPDRAQCTDLLIHDPGQRFLNVKAGTRACVGTEGKPVGHWRWPRSADRGR